MTVIKAKKIVKRAEFDGLPKVSDFGIVEEQLTQIKNGEVLVEAEVSTLICVPELQHFPLAAP